MQSEKKSKKWVLILIPVLLIIVVCIVYYLFKFNVVIKYNNDLDNTVENIRFLGLVDESLLNTHLSKEGYSFVGFYETYILSSEEIESVKSNPSLESNICKDGFTYNSTDYKCTSSSEFNFNSNRITKDTTIEVLWKLNEKQEEQGRVENATVTLNADNYCLVGVGSEVNITAKIKGNIKDKSIKWELPKCYLITRVSDTNYKLVRSKDCEANEEMNTIVSVYLTNGNKYTLKLNYEPKLTYKVFDKETVIKAKNGAFKCSNCKIDTNIPSTFKTLKNSSIWTTSAYSITLNEKVNETVTIKTKCNQTKTVEVSK